MVGGRNSFKKFPEIICTGNIPSLSEVITAIKQTNGTKIGKEVLIIEVPVDVLEYCGYVPIEQNAKAFITSCFETVFGLKNKNGMLEMYHCGTKTSIGGKRKYIAFPTRMFVNRPPGERKKIILGRFGCASRLTETSQIGKFASVSISMVIPLMIAMRTSAGLPAKTTKTTKITVGPGGLMLHELIHTLHSKF